MKNRLTLLLRKILIICVNVIVNSLFQRHCLICKIRIYSMEEGHLCSNCRENIQEKDLNRCEICSIELGNGNFICGQCEIDPPPFSRHVSYSIYREEMRKLILLYKLSGKENLKYYIAGLYKAIIDEHFKDEFDIIIPVPPDPGRKKVFNPVSAIGVILSKQYGTRFSDSNLIKIKSTAKQSSLNFKNRIKNLNNTFFIKDPSELSAKTVLLIDDVYTTGTTIRKCSKLLKKYSKKVYVVTLARSSNIFLDY